MQKNEASARELENWVASIEASPFNPKYLEKFLEGKERELEWLLQLYQNAASKTAKKAIVHFPRTRHEFKKLPIRFENVLCFGFQVTAGTTEYLEAENMGQCPRVD